ncbi:39S ribosomal protein L16, mitochondrial isoform X1 [Dermochelys coriacea]|uniref:39S ribosomal protein L16, mitochondrial isoform X1 n=1 Tax=Dermochelys coriacea TaxID=27794 RepID=UPI0018E78859|nr:39S ribosomal protein L16, mitochondrial isoform X1 [Dermochelys coriacea]
MWRRLARPLGALPKVPGDPFCARVLSAGLKSYVLPQDYTSECWAWRNAKTEGQQVPCDVGHICQPSLEKCWGKMLSGGWSDISIPDRPKLKFMDKVPSVPKVRREFKNLRDIRGPSTEATEFTQGQYGILALGGGYLHWGHFEMMRLTINRHLDPKIMFAVWRIPAPYKPITRKSLGQRMGGGKGAIDHYVTAVKCGRLILEVGGHCEFGEVEHFLTQVAKKLPFPAKAVSCQSLEEMRQAEEERRRKNQNPWTFERVITSNMLGSRKVLSPYDLSQQGRYWGKFFLKDRV